MAENQENKNQSTNPDTNEENIENNDVGNEPEDKYETSKPTSAVSTTEEKSGLVGAEETKSINEEDEAALSEQKEQQQQDGAETGNNPKANEGGASSSDNATPRRRSKTETVDHPNGGYEIITNIWNSDGSKKMIVTKVLPLDDDDQEYKLVTYRKKTGETYSEEHLTNISDEELEDFKRKFDRPPQKTNQDEIQENTENNDVSNEPEDKIEDQTSEGEKTGWFGWGPKKDKDASSDDED